MRERERIKKRESKHCERETHSSRRTDGGGQCAQRERVNDEKLCRPRLSCAFSRGYETARRIDGQTDENNEWPFLPSGDGPTVCYYIFLFLSLSLFLLPSLTCSPSFSPSPISVLRVLGEKRIAAFTDERKNNSLPPWTVAYN